MPRVDCISSYHVTVHGFHCHSQHPWQVCHSDRVPFADSTMDGTDYSPPEAATSSGQQGSIQDGDVSATENCHDRGTTSDAGLGVRLLVVLRNPSSATVVLTLILFLACIRRESGPRLAAAAGLWGMDRRAELSNSPRRGGVARESVSDAQRDAHDVRCRID